ncbi:MAG TPA: homoserine kinase [Sediminispirochaeta sp.]|nr:homoserine kinase [Sediminispirochaeta sp.]
MEKRPNTAVQRAAAFAPATVANVAVGYDILGFSLEAAGDTVVLERSSHPGLEIVEISGLERDLPKDPRKNVAGFVVRNFLEKNPLPFGLKIWINKGIPLSSGMGGSAASASAALWALSSFYLEEIRPEELLPYALEGERLATGDAHGDNVTPCLFGGLTLLRSLDGAEVVQLPFPEEIRVMLIHPHLRLDTRDGRAALGDSVPIKVCVEQSGNLAGFLAGCFSKDLTLIGSCLRDVMVEPKRAPLVPGFAEVKQAALSGEGVLGFSLAGSGPSVFAWCQGEEAAEAAKERVRDVWRRRGVDSEGWVSRIGTRGARIIKVEEE